MSMFKKALVAVTVALACPTFVFAQNNIDFLFGGSPDSTGALLPEAGAPNPASNAQTVDISTTSGSVNIYVAPDSFGILAADINFFSSDTSVAQITGGTAFNPTTIFGERFDSSVVTVDGSGASGNLFSVAVLGRTTGIDPNLGQFDPQFNDVDGFLLARVDYNIVGAGTTEFSFDLGPLGILATPLGITIDTVFNSATLTVVPEPSSALLLILSSVAMVARRRRA